MNSRFVPETPSEQPAGNAAVTGAALVTASFAADFERCRLLCESVDRFVTGMSQHYLLVEHHDVAQFRQLETPYRTVVDERDLLPSWLHCFRDPTSLYRRRIWLSTKTMPLRGWHVQQLRRIAVGAHVGEDVLVYCDSDVAFLKPFDFAAFRQGRAVRLFRRDNALKLHGMHEQSVWSRNAGAVLGIAAPETSPHDYVATLIAWRRDALAGLCRRIEDVTGRHWVSALGMQRRFSECMLYGRYVDEVQKVEGHFHGHEELCRVHWTGTPMSDEEFHAFVDDLTPDQVAIGMQSFIGSDLGRVRRLVLGA